MMQNDSANDRCTELENELQTADYIETKRVAPRHRYDELPNRYDDTDPDFAAVIREADSYGDTLRALAFDPANVDGSEVLVRLTRRDDCYNEDGSRPSWSVRAVGEFEIEGLEADEREDDLRDWVETETDHARAELLRSITEAEGMFEVEDIEAGLLHFYDAHEHGHVQIEYTLGGER